MGQSKTLIQIAVAHTLNTGDANEKLRAFQRENPNREIIGVNMVPADPGGWFMTVSYKIQI